MYLHLLDQWKLLEDPGSYLLTAQFTQFHRVDTSYTRRILNRIRS